MNKPKVYLAGPIQHADYGGHMWRDYLVDTYYEFEFINPLDKYDGNADAIIVHNGNPPTDADPTAEFVSTTELVETDKELVRNCDAVIVNWEDIPSCGTPMEVLYAYERNIPVVCRYDGNSISPWMEYHTETIHSSLDDCVEHLLKNLSPHG